jgi:hypothetical protein
MEIVLVENIYNVLTFNQIIHTDEMLCYWDMRIKTTTSLQKKLNKSVQKSVIAQSTGDIMNTAQDKINSARKSKRKVAVEKVSFWL